MAKTISLTSISDILGLLIDSLRAKPKIRRAIFIGAIAALLVFGAVMLISKLFPNAIALNLEAKEFVQGALALFGVLLVIVFLAYTPIRIGRGGFEIDLEELKEERKTIKERLEKGEREDILTTVHLNLNQLTEYYAINKSQARNSFRFSIFAIVLGLATVIGGVWFFLLGKTPNVTMTIITGMCGCVIEFIGGSYLFIYNKSIEQLNIFYIQLIRTQNTMLAIKLMESVEPKDKKTEMIEKIIHSLLTIDPSRYLTRNRRSERTDAPDKK